MAVEHPSQPTLGCGRLLDDVWATIDRPANSHEQDCPDCRAARRSLGGLATLVSDVRDGEGLLPDLQPNRGVRRSVLAVARAEVRRGRRIPMSIDDLASGETADELTVSEQALADLVRRTADQVPGIRVRRVQVRPPVQDVNGPVALRITTSVAYGRAIAPATTDLRDAVRIAVTAQTGLDLGLVDIVVEDVHDR